MKISQLAKQTGLSTKTIRYYESIDLISKPERADNGYRSYEQKDVDILNFIQSSRKMGFSLKDVKSLLALWQDKNRASRDVRILAQNHIEEIEERIKELQSIRNTLKNLMDSCHGDDRPDCPILTGLSKDADYGAS
jgi:MerR family copper efflux transcriptional regulator